MDVFSGLLALFGVVFCLIPMVKLIALKRHSETAWNVIDSSSIEDRLRLIDDHHNHDDIDSAYRWGLRINPFKWKFKHYYPRLAAEIERRENLNKEK